MGGTRRALFQLQVPARVMSEHQTTPSRRGDRRGVRRAAPRAGPAPRVSGPAARGRYPPRPRRPLQLQMPRRPGDDAEHQTMPSRRGDRRGVRRLAPGAGPAPRASAQARAGTPPPPGGLFLAAGRSCGPPKRRGHGRPGPRRGQTVPPVGAPLDPPSALVRFTAWPRCASGLRDLFHAGGAILR